MKGRLARGAVWIAATRGAVGLIGLVSTLLMARLLVPEDFGLVAIATTVIAIVTSVTEVSLSTALVQHRDPTEEHYNTAFTLGAIRAVLVSAITAALAWPIASLYGDERLVGLVLALAAGSALSGLGNPKLVDFVRALVFRQDFLLGVSNRLIGLTVAATIAIVWRSYWALAAAMIVSQLSQVALSYMLVRYRPRLSLEKTRELLSFSIWLTLSRILAVITYRFDTLIIGYFVGKPQLGAYSFGDNLAVTVTRELTAPVANTLFPAFSRIEGNVEKLSAAYAKAQSVIFMIAIPIGFGFALVAESFVNIVIGEKWSQAIIVIQMLAPIFALQSIMNPAQPLLMAMGKTRTLFNRELMFIGLRLPMFVFGLWFAGIFGALCARAAGGVLGIFLNLHLLKQEIRLPLWNQFKGNVRPLIAAAVMAVLVFGVRWMESPGMTTIERYFSLAGQICGGGLAYLAALWITWTISGRPPGGESEVLSLISRRRRALSVQ